MPGRLEFAVGFKKNKAEPQPQDDETGGDAPFRILICGDFGGRRAGAAPKNDLKNGPLRVDIDNFGDVFARLRPRISLSVFGGNTADTAIEGALGSIDDFHPDALCRILEPLRALCEARQRLRDPRTSAEMIAAFTRASDGDAPAPAAAPVAESPGEGDDATMARLLGRAPSAAPASPASGSSSGAASAIDDMLRRAVAPHIAPSGDPRQSRYVASVEEVLTAHLESVLHDPGFQRLEATWRALQWLVSSLGPDEDLQIHILDVSKEDLAAEAAATAASPDGLLVGPTGKMIRDSGPWSTLIGDYTFTAAAGDLTLVTILGALGRAVHAPLLCAADGRLGGGSASSGGTDVSDWIPLDAEAAARWRAARRHPDASWVGLMWPRFLLRLPYGAKTDPIESFPFEEATKLLTHEAFLWGNAAYAGAALIGLSFRESGASMSPDDVSQLADLPLYTYEDSGERKMLPCAECWITERAIDAIVSQGIMPLVSARDRNVVRLPRMQSIADPPAALSGFDA